MHTANIVSFVHLTCMKCIQSLKHVKIDESSFSYICSLKRPHSIQQKYGFWERMLNYYIYLILTGMIFILKKKIKNLFQKQSKYCDQKELKTTCSSGPSFALRQDQIFSTQSLKMSSELYL